MSAPSSRSSGSRRGVFEVALGRRTAAADEPAVELDGDAVAFDASGVDEVVYRLAPNPGEPARPLARIASGGELSRVALADQAGPRRGRRDADARLRRGRHRDRRPQRGPGRAEPVGARPRHQVLCVTHLPQIAAHADAHFRIAKRERDGRTVTEVERLDREGRIVELAAMLGGESRATRRRWPPPASCSTAPRPGGRGRSGAADGPATATTRISTPPSTTT